MLRCCVLLLRGARAVEIAGHNSRLIPSYAGVYASVSTTCLLKSEPYFT